MLYKLFQFTTSRSVIYRERFVATLSVGVDLGNSLMSSAKLILSNSMKFCGHEFKEKYKEEMWRCINIVCTIGTVSKNHKNNEKMSEIIE